MGKIEVNGIHFYYETAGKGPPLVLISGYTTDISAWSLIRDQLAEHFQIFMFDNRGAGRTDSPDSPYTIEGMAEDTIALIQALGINKPHIIGHSMGGAIAQTVAFKNPQLIGKLVLISTLIKVREPQRLAIQFYYKLRVLGIPLITILEGKLPWLFSSSFLKSQEKIASFLEMAESYPYAQTLTGQKRQLEAILGFNSESWFHTIQAPTLVIEGQEDILCPFDSKRLAQGIKQAQLITFTDQAHMSNIERPDQLADAILKFLR